VGRPPPPGARAAALIVAASLVGPIALVALSDDGIHATPDSFSYLGAADRLASGDGWTYPFGEVGAPVTLFPPLYSLILAVPAAIDVDPFAWVRWQNVLLFALLAASVGWVVFRETGDRVVPAILASLLVQLGVPTVQAYARIWSETLFLPLVVVALAALARHVVTRRPDPLILAAALSGAAMLTRYAGLALFVTGCALLIAWPGRPARARAGAIGVYATIAALPSALWLLRNSLASGTLTGDNRLIHELRAADVAAGLRRITAWLVPDAPRGALGTVVVVVAVAASVALVAALIWILVRGTGIEGFAPSSIVPVCLAYVVVHFVFIVVANAFSTRAPPFNDRILGPSFAPLVIAVVVTGDAIWRGARGWPLARVAVATLGASVLALSIIAATESMPAILGGPVGSATEFRALDRALTPQLPTDGRLYSTRPSVAWFLAGRPVRDLPRSCRGGRVLPNPRFRDELGQLGESLGERPRAVIVFGRSKECEPFSIPLLRRELRLARVDPRAPTGPVWVLAGPAQP
jgi:hypothetical protein